MEFDRSASEGVFARGVTPMNATLYARAPTHDQQTFGLQSEAMSAFIRNPGRVATRPIEDVGSRSKGCPGRESLLMAARRREVDVTVIWRRDLLHGRPFIAAMHPADELREAGVSLARSDHDLVCRLCRHRVARAL
jgi:hypothetical protein